MKHKDTLAIVTGCSRGIGLATARVFTKLGYKVIGCASTESSIKEAKAALPEVEFKLVDMTDKAQINSFATYILSLNKNIHCLVNNMGVFKPGDFESCKGLDDLEFLMQANLYSATYMVENVKSKFIAQKSGSIVNVSSIAGIQALAGSSLYCVSKFAMQGYSLCLRQDMKKHNVRVITIMPGATYTSSWKGTPLPEERFIPSEDVANVIANAVQTSDRTVVEEILIRPVQGDI